jgi:hypothetical protein
VAAGQVQGSPVVGDVQQPRQQIANGDAPGQVMKFGDDFLRSPCPGGIVGI